MHPVRHIVIVLLWSTLAAQPVSGQERDVRSGVARMPSTTTTPADTVVPPPVDLMVLKSTGWSLLFGVSGALVGMFIDDQYCESEHGDEETYFVPPCFFYTATGTPAGWFAGAAAGAAFGAVRVARKRGCTSPYAFVRAVGGALVGVAPGAIVIATRSEFSGRGLLIGAAPLLAGVGATIALHGCRS